jgi:hypothetical protein
MQQMRSMQTGNHCTTERHKQMGNKLQQLRVRTRQLQQSITAAVPATNCRYT